MQSEWKPVTVLPDLPVGGFALLSIEPGEVIIGRWAGDRWVYHSSDYRAVLGWMYLPEPIRPTYAEVPVSITKTHRY